MMGEKEARQSIMDELKAINDYEFRKTITGHEKLVKIYEHLIKEEKEHVAMLMSWLREADKDQNDAYAHQLNGG